MEKEDRQRGNMNKADKIGSVNASVFHFGCKNKINNPLTLTHSYIYTKSCDFIWDHSLYYGGGLTPWWMSSVRVSMGCLKILISDPKALHFTSAQSQSIFTREEERKIEIEMVEKISIQTSCMTEQAARNKNGFKVSLLW